MTLPYRYTKGAAAGRDETCVLCGSRSTRLVVDHCHEHGYSRGLLCGSCNNRLASLDAGTAAPTPREAFYLGNCPECRKAESPDSPDAFALHIGTVALTVTYAMGLSPRQAGALALSLAEIEPPSSDRKQNGGERTKTESTNARTERRLSGERLKIENPELPRLSPDSAPWTDLHLKQAVAKADELVPGLTAPELSKVLAQVGVIVSGDSVRAHRSALRAKQRFGPKA